MNTKQSVLDHIRLMENVESRVNSIVAVTGMTHDEVYHAVYMLNEAWDGDIITLLDWVYQGVTEGITIKDMIDD